MRNIYNFLKKNTTYTIFFAILLITILTFFVTPTYEGFSIDDISGKIDSVVSKITNISDQIAQFPQGITNIGNQISGIPNTINNSLNSAVGGLNNQISGIGGTIGNTITEFERDFTSKLTDVTGTINNKLTGFRTDITNVSSQVQGGVGQMQRGITDLTQQVRGGIGQMESGITDITRQVESGIHKVEDEVKGGIDQMESGITDLTRQVRGGINEMKDGITDITHQAEAFVENGIRTIRSEMDNAMRLIRRETQEFLINKITSVFRQLGELLDDGIIDPFKHLFTGIGSIFVELFGILTMIGDKIVSLPGCMPFYFFFGMFDNISRIFTSILPNFITNPLRQLYNFAIRPIINIILTFIGYDNSKCYGFNVNAPISRINGTLRGIGNNFTSSFGNIRFNSIRI